MALNSKTFSILCSNQRVKGHLKQALKILPVAINVKNIHRHEAHLANQKGRNKGLKDLPELREKEAGGREGEGRRTEQKKMLSDTGYRLSSVDIKHY